MRTLPRYPSGPASGRAAFTLPEMMVTMVLFTLVVGGVIFSHIYGLRMFEISRAKLGASDEARRAISRMTEEIRMAKTVRVGNGTLDSFTDAGMTNRQAGNAIQVHLSTNDSQFVRYFWDSGDKRLKRTTNGFNSAFVVANAITNAVIFTSEDHAGNVLTNSQNNRVIGLTLQFFQLQYPAIDIGPGGLYDFYQLRTRITRRALE